MRASSLFSLSEHLERLSRDGDSLEVLSQAVNFERFRLLLVERLGYSDGAKGGRPLFDPVSMFKVSVVQAQHNLSDARMEFMIRGPVELDALLQFRPGQHDARREHYSSLS